MKIFGKMTQKKYKKTSYTVNNVLLLGKYFGVSPEIWLNLQVDYDMRIARRTIWPSVEPRVRVRVA